MAVKVSTLENELKFEVDLRKKGREFFDLVSKTLGVHETWFFGIYYKDADDESIWIDGSKKALKEIKHHLHKLKYRAKFYPEDVEEELFEEITVRYFYLQVKAHILQDVTYCPPETCVLLASYAAQVKYGDYTQENVEDRAIWKQNWLPERVYKQHAMERNAWEANIVSLWKKHRGLAKEDAMLEYLKLAQNLEMYGVTYFQITNKKGTPLLLGITSLGLNIYRPNDKMNPTIAFPWSEIRNLSFRDKKFSIKQNDKKSEGFIFFVSEAKTNKQILSLGVGNHALYVRRRKPESFEILQMKSRAVEAKSYRNQQIAKLQSEMSAREQAELREKQYQEQIKALQDEMERNRNSLLEAQQTIHQLKQQLEDVQKAKQHLEEQQQELRDMMQRLEESKNMEAAERQKLEYEIKLKQSEVQKIQEEVDLKNEEAMRLQELVEEAQRREAEMKERELAEKAKKEEEPDNLEVLPNGLDDKLPELVAVNEDLKDQLRKLQEQLEATRDKSQDTPLDKIHRDNLRAGRDKYKTLAEIRKGNTVRRVDLFENL